MWKGHRCALLFLPHGQKRHPGGRWALAARALEFLLPGALRLLWDKLRFLLGMHLPPPQMEMEGHMMWSQAVLKCWEQKCAKMDFCCLHSGKHGIWLKHQSRGQTASWWLPFLSCVATHIFVLPYFYIIPDHLRVELRIRGFAHVSCSLVKWIWSWRNRAHACAWASTLHWAVWWDLPKKCDVVLVLLVSEKLPDLSISLPSLTPLYWWHGKIIFWIDWVRLNIFLKLTSPVSFYFFKCGCYKV